MNFLKNVCRAAYILIEGAMGLCPERLRRRIHCSLKVRYFQGRFDGQIRRYEKAVDGQFPAVGEGAVSKLRMCAHILDKGLHRLDWEPGHGQDVYERALELLNLCDQNGDPTVIWAQSVLAEYERRQRLSVTGEAPLGAPVSKSNISASEFQEFAEGRVSVRYFEEKHVDPEQVKKIVRAGLAASSSCNRQTLKIYACCESGRASKIAALFHGFTCFSSFIPCMFVICADVRGYQFPGELFVPTYDTGLAASNMALMAHAMDMSMTQLVWSGGNNRETDLREVLGIPEHEAIVVGAVCGVPRCGAIRPARKRVEDTVVFS